MTALPGDSSGAVADGPADPAPGSKHYTLLGADRRPYLSATPGEFGGHRKSKVYGRLNCRAALREIAAGGYVANRVFSAPDQEPSPHRARGRTSSGATTRSSGATRSGCLVLAPRT